ncbi:MAG: GTPase domain-containing protein [Accumulibacter sp.]|uniref:GTPase domain-containing protein n=1 Tax=Accumulibacter sp. TaxID=2053492 RepID=UPI003314C924
MRNIRVLVFGATGTGKTSLCNTLTGRKRPTDNGARGITAKSHLYPAFQTDDCRIEIIDTVGLHESSHGTVPAEQAVVELIDLLEKARDGFSLLVQVTRASRITNEHDEDYKFFVEKMTQGNIPVILAVTGCENEYPMTSWVDRNQEAFSRFAYKELVPTCFASGGPMEEFFAPLRLQSREHLLGSIIHNALVEPRKLYGTGTSSSFNQSLTRIWNEFVAVTGLPKKYRRQVNESAYTLMKRLGVPQAIADTAIKHIPDLLEELGNKSPVPGGGKLLRKLSELFLNRLSNGTRKND